MASLDLGGPFGYGAGEGIVPEVPAKACIPLTWLRSIRVGSGLYWGAAFSGAGCVFLLIGLEMSSLS